jgi:hypothetical protein
MKPHLFVPQDSLQSRQHSGKGHSVVVDLEALARLESMQPGRTVTKVQHRRAGDRLSTFGEPITAPSVRAELPDAGPDWCAMSPSARHFPIREIAGLLVLTLIAFGFRHFNTRAGIAYPSVAAAVSGNESKHRPSMYLLAQGDVVVAQASGTPSPTPEQTTSVLTRVGSGSRMGRFHVEIKAIETSWISATSDGKKTLNKLLTKKQTSVVEFAEAVRLTIGNAGGVEISLEGKPIGPVGLEGVVRFLELTPTGFRFLPRDTADPVQDPHGVPHPSSSEHRPELHLASVYQTP